MSEVSSKKCPYCGGELLAQAMQCRHCRRWMPDVAGIRAPEEPQRAAAPPPVDATTTHSSAEHTGISPGQNPVHLVILSILSLGLYEFYWIWRSWTALRDETGADISPRWRTIAFLVPFVNVIVLYFLMRDTKELAKRREVPADFSPGTLTAMFYALRLLGNAALVGGAPFAWLAGMATVLPLVPVQIVWNAYWKKTRPDSEVRATLSSSELAIAVLAGLGVMMIAALLSTGADPMSLPE